MKLFDLATLLLIANKTKLNLRFIRSPSVCTFYSKVRHLSQKIQKFLKNLSAHKFCVLSHITSDSSTADFLIATTFLLLMSNAPWSRVLAEKLTGPQQIEIFPAFYGTRTCMNAFTGDRQRLYFEPDQSSPCLPIALLEDPF